MPNDFGQANREFDDPQGGYSSPYDGSYDLGADRGDSMSYGGGSSSYGRQAPEYVPPLTAKTPASPPASPNWSPPPTSQYDYSANASLYSAPSGGERLPPSDLARGPASLAHAGVSSSAVKPGEYIPGGLEPPAWAAPDEPARNPSAGPSPYYWEQAARAPQATIVARAARLAVTALLVFTALFSFAYAGISAYSAYTLIYAPPVVATTTPAKFGLAYKEVSFTSRTDHVGLQGWFIPGVGANGALTDARTIIVVHGTRTNRADPGAGVLDLSAALARHGFAVLAFDMRGMGASQPAPLSLGQYEQRDVLGAVDYLRTGDAPYPNLGRPAFIGGWGVSMGAATLLMAAAQEPAIRAVVSDSAYSDILPILQREIPKRSGLPGWFTPGVLKAVQTMYSIDFSKVRPVDVVAKVAPRPILFIQGADDTYVPDGDLTALAQAAQQGSGAQIQTWLVPGAKHAQAYHVAGQAYVDKVVAFFAANLR